MLHYVSVYVSYLYLYKARNVKGAALLSVVYCCVSKCPEEAVTEYTINTEQSTTCSENRYLKKDMGLGIAERACSPALRRLGQEDCPHWTDLVVTVPQARLKK